MDFLKLYVPDIIWPIAAIFLIVIIFEVVKYISKEKAEQKKRTHSQKSYSTSTTSKVRYTRQRYVLDYVDIDQLRESAYINIYDRISNRYFTTSISLDEETLKQLPYSSPPLSTFADEIRRRVSMLPSDWRIEAKIYKFWRDADKIIEDYANEHDIDSLTEFIQNIWETRNLKTYSVELHFMIIKAIQAVYPYREERENNIDLIIYLCELDISNYVNLKHEMDITRVSLISTQKKAILLEKRGRYEEALEFSEWCRSNNLRETRDKSFDTRIERLRKKLNK